MALCDGGCYGRIFHLSLPPRSLCIALLVNVKFTAFFLFKEGAILSLHGVVMIMMMMMMIVGHEAGC
jgi:hypothetical protein